MEVLQDGKFDLIETNNLIVKNMNTYTITVDTILSDLASGTMYIVDNSNTPITIVLPYRMEGLNYTFIFNNTNNNSIIFKTSVEPLDNSKFIGTDWLYLKRSYIDISYSVLTGSKLEFSKSEKGEYIKFYSDGNHYYIIDKNDTNNNINNIVHSYPTSIIENYIININSTTTGYTYDIINELTNVGHKLRIQLQLTY